MNWLRQWLERIFGRRKPETDWAALNYGKPSTAGDDFRKGNDV